MQVKEQDKGQSGPDEETAADGDEGQGPGHRLDGAPQPDTQDQHRPDGGVKEDGIEAI